MNGGYYIVYSGGYIPNHMQSSCNTVPKKTITHSGGYIPNHMQSSCNTVPKKTITHSDPRCTERRCICRARTVPTKKSYQWKIIDDQNILIINFTINNSLNSHKKLKWKHHLTAVFINLARNTEQKDFPKGNLFAQRFSLNVHFLRHPLNISPITNVRHKNPRPDRVRRHLHLQVWHLHLHGVREQARSSLGNPSYRAVLFCEKFFHETN